jgi:hypothetical protein
MVLYLARLKDLGKTECVSYIAASIVGIPESGFSQPIDERDSD